MHLNKYNCTRIMITENKTATNVKFLHDRKKKLFTSCFSLFIQFSSQLSCIPLHFSLPPCDCVTSFKLFIHEKHSSARKGSFFNSLKYFFVNFLRSTTHSELLDGSEKLVCVRARKRIANWNKKST